MNKVVKKTGFKYGIIGFIIYFFSCIIMWQVDIALFINPLVPYPLAILILCLGIYAQRTAKTQSGGYITFGNALLSFVITIAIAISGYAIACILIFNLIDPNAKELLLDITIKESLEMSNRMLTFMGMENAAGQLTEEQMRQSMQIGPTPMGIPSIIINYISNLAFYTVVGLIAAAIIKKDKPYEFE